MTHIPVLLDETVAALGLQADSVVLDGTYGRGGHARAILERLGPNGCYIAFDKDPQAIAQAEKHAQADPRLQVIFSSFANLSSELSKRGIHQVDAALFDLGVSSPQLDDAERGFSFSRPGPLDMRMNTTQGLSAAQWLNTAPEKAIADVIYTYGQERQSRRIARKVVEQRQETPFSTTDQLADIVRSCVRATPGKDPATRTFQAIRIHINNEFEEIEQGLSQVFSCLKPNGRLAVISFHSLEDAIVKRFMRSKARAVLPKGLAVPDSAISVDGKIIGKAIRPGSEELARNVRARSSTLRVLEKIG